MSINPLTPNSAGTPPSNQDALSKVPVATNWDPSGMWSKWLGGASPQEVQVFLQGLMKSISVTIQQQEQECQKAAKKMKAAMEGDDDSS